MKKEQLQDLFKKYSNGTCTEEEKAQLESWYLQHNEYRTILGSRKIDAAKSLIFLKLPGNEITFPKIGIRLAAAAVLIGVIISVTFALMNLGKPKNTNVIGKDLPPGGNKATLITSNGERFNLTDASKGTLLKRSGVVITKNQAGQVTYSFNSSARIDHSQNSISTPAGGQWEVQLSDGTNVWLNSASKITFPTSFVQSENRIVTLDGEGYFEVAKDPTHPFIVISGNQRVEVLGTHFNINSYTNEPAIKTTLIQGRIKVTLLGNNKPVILRPGDQATVTVNAMRVEQVDTDEAIAWKEGYFQFNNEPIPSVMRKLARWYDVDFKADSNISTDGITGKVSRNKNISQVMKALEATKTVHFKLEGRRITVMK
jgi:transmembrane sensor